MKKKDDIIKGIKQALEHKREELKRTEQQWSKEGIKGKVVLV